MSLAVDEGARWSGAPGRRVCRPRITRSRVYKSDHGRRAVEAQYRAWLDRWPAPHEERRIPTREGETFVVVCGAEDGPPVVLFQGAQSNAASWLALADVPALAGRFRLYAVDTIGEPGFSAPSRPPFATEHHALWLDDVMAGLGLERAAMVGLSLGGWLALDYAIRRPGRVERLALLCPAGVGGQKPEFYLQLAMLLPLGSWGWRRLRRLVFGVSPVDLNPDKEEFAKFVTLVQRHSTPSVLKAPVLPDDMLSRLRAPTLAILGGADPILDSHATRRRLEALAPHVEVRWLPDAGHLLLEQTEAIAAFLGA